MANIIFEVHPLLVPSLATRQQNEAPAVQGVKRVDDLNPLPIVGITCS